MDRSIIFKLLLVVFCLCPMDGYAMNRWGGLSPRQARVVSHVHCSKRTEADWDRIREAQARNLARETAVINQYQSLQQLESPGYIYRSTAGRKKVGRIYVKIHTFIVKFKKKMKCNEFDGYYKHMRSIINKAGRGSVYCVLKGKSFTQLTLEIRDTISIDGFKLMLRKVNHLFKNNPRG